MSAWVPIKSKETLTSFNFDLLRIGLSSQIYSEIRYILGIAQKVKLHALLHTLSDVRIPQYLYVCVQFVDEKRLGVHVDHQEVSRCCTRGESEKSIAYSWGSMQMRDPPWL